MNKAIGWIFGFGWMAASSAWAVPYAYDCTVVPATADTAAVLRELRVDSKSVTIQFGNEGIVAWDQPTRPAGVPHGYTKIANSASPETRLWDAVYIAKSAFDGESESAVLEERAGAILAYPCTRK